MSRLTQKSCEEYIELLASKAPIPGGGGASALVAALGIALSNMVGSLTLGNAKYAAVESEIVSLKVKADELQQAFVALAERDAEVFELLANAYGLPKDTEQQRVHRTEVMDKCLIACCSVPLEIMECCAKAIDLHAEFASKGTAIAISDVGCGVIICKAAMQAASLNVFINTKSMTDRIYAEEVNSRAYVLLTEFCAKADIIFQGVAAKFN
jgi:formiminotetrahydrofolate cyclodeaminase